MTGYGLWQPRGRCDDGLAEIGEYPSRGCAKKERFHKLKFVMADACLVLTVFTGRCTLLGNPTISGITLGRRGIKICQRGMVKQASVFCRRQGSLEI